MLFFSNSPKTRAKAIDSVRSGSAYAAFIIPSDFTSTLSGVLNGNAQPAPIDYYVNEKENAIAPKVTDTGATTLESQISSEFVRTVGEVASEKLKGASGEALDTARSGIDSVANTLREAASQASGLADGIADMDAAVATARSAIADARDALSSASAQAGTLAGRLGMALASAKSTRGDIRSPTGDLSGALTGASGTLAIWIGGVVLAALIKATPSARALRETGCTVTQAYLGRLALFCGTGIIQAAIICIGDVGYLGVQCAHPGLFLLAGCLASVVFISIIFALTSSFGDIGKAVAVVLMVVQVAGAGGTCPAQMLPPVFQMIYEWLPFVHAEGAMRAALFGVYNGDFWVQLAILAAYAVPALALGLLLRRPTAHAVKRFEEALESTRVM